MKCAYCSEEAKGTREHIISCAVLDLFPECHVTFDTARKAVYLADPMIKDVCATCNNQRISYIDGYARDFMTRYAVKNYNEDDTVEIEYDYTMIQKVLLKYAFNALRSHNQQYSFFDEEIRHYLMHEDDNTPKNNVTVLCGLAINVSPLSDAMTGNRKLRWCKDPLFFENSTIQHIDYTTGKVFINEKGNKLANLPDLNFSYLFRFNNIQFLLLCWNKDSTNIEQNNIVLSCQYPYYLMTPTDKIGEIRLCTDELNYHREEFIHVTWDLLFEVGTMRKLASGGTYKSKELYDKLLAKEEEKIINENPRYR